MAAVQAKPPWHEVLRKDYEYMQALAIRGLVGVEVSVHVHMYYKHIHHSRCGVCEDTSQVNQGSTTVAF